MNKVEKIYIYIYARTYIVIFIVWKKILAF